MPLTELDVPIFRIELQHPVHGWMVVKVLYKGDNAENKRQWELWLKTAKDHRLAVQLVQVIDAGQHRIHRSWDPANGLKVYAPGRRRGQE